MTVLRVAGIVAVALPSAYVVGIFLGVALAERNLRRTSG